MLSKTYRQPGIHHVEIMFLQKDHDLSTDASIRNCQEIRFVIPSRKLQSSTQVLTRVQNHCIKERQIEQYIEPYIAVQQTKQNNLNKNHKNQTSNQTKQDENIKPKPKNKQSLAV